MLLKKNIYVAKILYNGNIKKFDIEKYGPLSSLYLSNPDTDYIPLIKIGTDKYVPLELVNHIAELYLAYIGVSDFILSTKKQGNHPYYIDKSSLFEFYPEEEDNEKISLRTLKELPF